MGVAGVGAASLSLRERQQITRTKTQVNSRTVHKHLFLSRTSPRFAPEQNRAGTRVPLLTRPFASSENSCRPDGRLPVWCAPKMCRRGPETRSKPAHAGQPADEKPLGKSSITDDELESGLKIPGTRDAVCKLKWLPATGTGFFVHVCGLSTGRGFRSGDKNASTHRLLACATRPGRGGVTGSQ